MTRSLCMDNTENRHSVGGEEYLENGMFFSICPVEGWRGSSQNGLFKALRNVMKG